MCVSVIVLATLISPIRASRFLYFYGEKSRASVVKVPAAILNPAQSIQLIYNAISLVEMACTGS